MAFEYDGIERFGTMKTEFVYFFNSSIILNIIKAGSKNSRICGLSIGSTCLMASHPKTISINVITRI
jgi:hypothetical protein